MKCNFYSLFLDFFFRRFFFFFFFFLSWSESELLEELDDEEELEEEDDEDELELELDEESESESELLSGFFSFLVDLKATKKHNSKGGNCDKSSQEGTSFWLQRHFCQ